ncbi:class I SAM-dependent methyltransferase [Altericista sp. CCNU0014]|uniref:class I SAM-dependent methyltransferase n=1 Tax=Altericista sp. CCNU0014 TaxID=3082949 RepID=UPI00384B90C5
MLLKPQERLKLDDTDDALFYSVPRFVTHLDDRFLETLTQLYRDRLQPHTRILDLMGSWVSHLPEEMAFDTVEGHGLNSEELARNPRYDRFFVQNLNQNPKLPLPDRSFDAVLNTASVQYLQYPEAVFSEICRILKPNGIAIVSFSNRMFFHKAIQVWRDGSEDNRLALVQAYINSVPGFEVEDSVIVRPKPSALAWLSGGQDPFYAVIGRRTVQPQT